MNKKIYFKIFINISVAIFLAGTLGTVIAKFTMVNNEKKFCRILNKPEYNLAVVMFYDSGKLQKKSNPHLYCMIRNMKEMFRGTSKVFRYNDADVMFMTVNVSQRKKRTKKFRNNCNSGCRVRCSCIGEYGFKQQYGIGAQPKFMLFRNGQPHKDIGGNIASLTGSITRSQLEKLIDSNFSRLIEQNRKRNAEKRQRCIERNMAAWAAWGPYWGPGWGWGGYWGGCGWGGFGLGSGWGGCGWSRCGGCRRRCR